MACNAPSLKSYALDKNKQNNSWEIKGEFGCKFQYCTFILKVSLKKRTLVKFPLCLMTLLCLAFGSPKWCFLKFCRKSPGKKPLAMHQYVKLPLCSHKRDIYHFFAAAVTTLEAMFQLGCYKITQSLKSHVSQI